MHRLPLFTLSLLAGILLLPNCQPIPEATAHRKPIPKNFGNGHSEPLGLGRIEVGSIPLGKPPATAATSVIVVDMKGKRILYAKNADQRRAVASTQKIITALCVLDAGNLDKPVRITSSDAHCEPTKLGLSAGEVYTRRELLKVLMVKSANDVGRALARDVAGSQAAFANMMNRKCAELGMRNSHFKNPHGLTEGGQYSTARDMAIAAIEAYQQPVLREFISTKQFTFRFNNGRTRQIITTNKVLRNLSYCTGMKTGTTRASGRCLVATGEVMDRSVVAVVLNSTTRHIWDDSTKLLRWGLER